MGYEKFNDAHHVLIRKIEVNRSSSFKKIFSWNACGIACGVMRDEWS